MASPLSRLLDEQFVNLRERHATAQARAQFLETDRTTFSKVVNGVLPLTEERALLWAQRFFPQDSIVQGDLARRLHLAAQVATRAQTVQEFCDRVVAEGGAVPAERISDLFAALALPQVRNALVLIEYRDIPRAGPQSKYHDLGRALARAVADRISFGMFMPFPSVNRLSGRDSQYDRDLVREGPSAAEKYMADVQDNCRRAYLSFRHFALREVGEERGAEVDRRLRLYEAGPHTPIPAGGIQAKLFYVQFDSEGPGGLSLRHHRLFQWVQTPTKDWLIYRGEAHIDPEAIRDSFFPVPHLFDIPAGQEDDHVLPPLPPAAQAEKARRSLLTKLEEEVAAYWIGNNLPYGRELWVSYEPSA